MVAARFLWSLFFFGSLAPICAADWPEAGARKYWNEGKAEITRYALSQSRYGELHEGEAVLIFVSEPFSRSKQVKLDDWTEAGGDLLNVLKLNFTKKFLTGIYPYSLMLSTFSPADASGILKTSMSGQEWCGHVFSQLNRRGDTFDLQDFSYFETEGDQRRQLPAALLEDELWSRIRLSPDRLPTGKIEIIPGSFASRLTHVPQKVEQAEATLGEAVSENLGKFNLADLQSFRLKYSTGSDRTLEIFFEKRFPHAIVAWEETYTDFSGKRLTTRGVKTASILSDYWKRHTNADRPLREKLDLSGEH